MELIERTNVLPYDSLQIRLEKTTLAPIFTWIRNKINKSDIFKIPDRDGEFGLPLDYHITLLSGLDRIKPHDRFNMQHEDFLMKYFSSIGPIPIKLGNLTTFGRDGGKYFVIVIPVESPQLNKIITELCFKKGYKHQSTKSSCMVNPHITVAYLKAISGGRDLKIHYFNNIFPKGIYKGVGSNFLVDEIFYNEGNTTPGYVYDLKRERFLSNYKKKYI